MAFFNLRKFIGELYVPKIHRLNFDRVTFSKHQTKGLPQNWKCTFVVSMDEKDANIDVENSKKINY